MITSPRLLLAGPATTGWLIYKPISKRYPVVDATNEIMATHQTMTIAILASKVKLLFAGSS